MANVFAYIFAMIVGGAVLAASTKAFDTMDKGWFAIWIGLLAVVIGGALLLDLADRTRGR